jgi:hypothetical protein
MATPSVTAPARQKTASSTKMTIAWIANLSGFVHQRYQGVPTHSDTGVSSLTLASVTVSFSQSDESSRAVSSRPRHVRR